MPTPDSKFTRIWYPGSSYNKSFSNYLVEFAGILDELIPEGAIRSPFMLTWAPDDSNKPTLRLNVWRVRAWEKSTPVHVYGIYNPVNDLTSTLTRALGGFGWVTRIGGIQALTGNIERQVKDAQIAAKGMLALRMAMQSLQKKRGDELAPEEFRDLAFQALPVMVGKGVQKLSQERLGKQLHLNRDTVGKYLAKQPGLYKSLQAEFKRLMLK